MTKELPQPGPEPLSASEILISAVNADPKLRKEFVGKYLVVQDGKIIGALDDITPLINMNDHLDPQHKYHFKFIQPLNGKSDPAS